MTVRKDESQQKNAAVLYRDGGVFCCSLYKMHSALVVA